MRTYKTQLLTSSIPNLYPDDPPALPAGTPAAPTLPDGEGKTALDSAEPPKVEGDPPKEEPAKDPPKEEPPKEEPPKEEPAKDAAPVVPEAYELKVQIEGKDVELDPAAVAAATPIFKAAGLTNDQAQAVVAHYATDVLPSVAQAVQQDTLRLLGMDGMGDWAKQLKADKEIGGANFDQNMTVIAQGRDAFATPELRALLETSRLGNHPEIARLFYKLGGLAAEGKIHGGAPASAPTAPEAILYGQEYQPKG